MAHPMTRRVAILVGALALAPQVAAADDTLKVAVGQRGLWDTSISEVGQRGGIFKKYGLNLDIVYTQGSGETQQAVISESVEVGVGIGIMGVLSAYSKGAPVRVIGTEIIGAGDLFWYVKADSPIKALTDTNGKTIAYSTNGSSTHGVVTAYIKQYNLTAKPVSTGGPPGTLTQVMSGQIDVGWSAPPFGLDLLDEGKIRLLSNGNDAHVFRGQTVRVLVANAKALQGRGSAIDRFMAGYRETIAWMYSDPAALKIYAEFAGVTEARAKQIRDNFFKIEALNPDQVVGLDIIMPDAIALKYVQAPLTKEQLAELIRIPPRQ
jgi:NitT/TauT family transport system substrate-binding protein